ncbi:MAG: hypothetical protein ABTR27_15190 [Candidatus Competibacter phosphatis]
MTETTLGRVSDNRRYNDFGEVKGYSATANGAAVFAVQYTRDPLGRITQKQETLFVEVFATPQATLNPDPEEPPKGVTHTENYAYDLAGHLVEVKRDGATAVAHIGARRLQRHRKGYPVWRGGRGGPPVQQQTCGRLGTQHRERVGRIEQRELCDTHLQGENQHCSDDHGHGQWQIDQRGVDRESLVLHPTRVGFKQPMGFPVRGNRRLGA